MIVIFKAIELLEVQNSRSIVSILVSRLKQHGDQGRMVMVRSIIIPRISKRWSNPHNILDIMTIILQGRTEYKLDSKLHP